MASLCDFVSATRLVFDGFLIFVLLFTAVEGKGGRGSIGSSGSGRSSSSGSNGGRIGSSGAWSYGSYGSHGGYSNGGYGTGGTGSAEGGFFVLSIIFGTVALIFGFIVYLYCTRPSKVKTTGESRSLLESERGDPGHSNTMSNLAYVTNEK